MLEIDNFKNGIMQPNTKRPKEIRLCNNNLEGAFSVCTPHTWKHEEQDDVERWRDKQCHATAHYQKRATATGRKKVRQIIQSN